MPRIPRSAPLLVSLALGLAPLPAAADPRVMFTTLEEDTGKLGEWAIVSAEGLSGIEAGNKICQDLAEAANLANFAAYRAWLSDSTTDAYCNVAGFSGKRADSCGETELPDAGPWVRTDGKPFAASLSALTDDSEVLYSPNVDQHGDRIAEGFTNVMTGTGQTGALSGNHCQGWTSEASGDNQTVGELNGGSKSWTNWSSWTCNQTLHLFCFESGVGTSLPPLGEPGADVFVTSNTGIGVLGDWSDANGQTGLAAGDEICQAAAARGFRPDPDSYVAWLSNSTVPAKDRLTYDGPWRRADGVQIVATKADLLQFPHDAAIGLDESGAPLATYAFTGSTAGGTSSTFTCGDWLQNTGDVTMGLSSTAGFFWTAGSSGDCSGAGHLLCFSNVEVLFADGFQLKGTGLWSKTVP